MITVLNKICKQCNEEKQLDLLHFRQCKYKSGKFYFKNICRICECNNSKKFNKNYKKSDEQKAKFAIYKKKWRKANADRENAKYKEKISTDICFKLRKNVSRAVNRALKIHGFSKSNTINKYLDWNIEELKKHLEKQFNKEMNWDNYGIYWHIDHIVPQSCLPYTNMSDDNFKKCWSLDNLRPLEAKQNMIDGSTRIRHKKFINGEI